MLTQYFGFQDEPFRVSPDNRIFFDARTHVQSLAEITAAIGERAGLTLLIGEPGTGKTVLLHRLEASLAAEGIPACHFRRPLASLTELAVACGGAAGPGAALPDDDALARLLIDTLTARLGAGGTAAVLADEAHAIAPDCLARLCRLAEQSNEAGGVLQVVLSGHQGLIDTLAPVPGRAAPGAEVRRVRLAPLSPSEVACYVRYRLGFVRYIGPEVFPAPAMARVIVHSRGNPARINRLCSTALLNAFLEDRRTVTPALVDRAAAEALIDGSSTGFADGSAGTAAGPEVTTTALSEPAATDPALDPLMVAIARLQQTGGFRPGTRFPDRPNPQPPWSAPPSDAPQGEPDHPSTAIEAPGPAEHAVSARDAARQARSDRWFRAIARPRAPGPWRVWDRQAGEAECRPAVSRDAHPPPASDPPRLPAVIAAPRRLRWWRLSVHAPPRRSAVAAAALMAAAVGLGTLVPIGGGPAPYPPQAQPQAAPAALPSGTVARPPPPTGEGPGMAPMIIPAAQLEAPPPEAGTGRAPLPDPHPDPHPDPLRLIGGGDDTAWAVPSPDAEGAAPVRFDPARLYPDRGFTREEDGVRLMPTEDGLRLIAPDRPAPSGPRPPPAQSAEAPPPDAPPQRGDCPGPRPRVPPDADMSLGEFIESFVDDVNRLGDCVF